MKKIILLLSTVILVFLAACTETWPEEEPEVVRGEVGFSGITEQQCIESRGRWNECGSPCAGTGAELCITVCQVQCECNKEELMCPEGFKCRLTGKIEGEIGVCIED